MPDETKNQLLFNASANGDIDQLRLALEIGANVNSTTYDFKNSSLQYAAEEGYVEIAKLLLQNKADVNIKDAYGETPLHYASRIGHRQKCYSPIYVFFMGSNQPERLRFILLRFKNILGHNLLYT